MEIQPKTNKYEAYRELGGLSYPTGESLTVTEYFQKISKLEKSIYNRTKTQNTDYSQALNKGGITEYIKAELSNPAISKYLVLGVLTFNSQGRQ